MAYHFIPLTTKEYQATLAKLMETPAKANPRKVVVKNADYFSGV